MYEFFRFLKSLNLPVKYKVFESQQMNFLDDVLGLINSFGVRFGKGKIIDFYLA